MIRLVDIQTALHAVAPQGESVSQQQASVLWGGFKGYAQARERILMESQTVPKALQSTQGVFHPISRKLSKEEKNRLQEAKEEKNRLQEAMEGRKDVFSLYTPLGLSNKLKDFEYTEGRYVNFKV